MTRSTKPAARKAAPNEEVIQTMHAVELAEAIDESAVAPAHGLPTLREQVAQLAAEVAARPLAARLGPDPIDAPVTHLHVRALADGYRRCGRAWPAAGVEVEADAYTEDELLRLLDDRGLVVTPICRAPGE